MRKFIQTYRQLDRFVWLLVAAEFCLQLINASFMLILNLYLSKKGYSDPIIADFVSYRFLGVLVLALPLGLFIKGRKLKPLFMIAGIAMPILSLTILYAIDAGLVRLLYASLCFWGISFTLMQICTLPYLLRNANPNYQSEAISLNYSTWSVSTVVSGLLIYVLTNVDPGYFNEKVLLQIFSVCGFFSLIFFSKIKIKEHVPDLTSKRMDMRDFDWPVILKALIPTLIIAVGAGLTIPFINLFFFSVHGMDSENFAAVGSLAALFVFFAALLIPFIRKRWGYRIAITLFQSMAVVALILLATTEFFAPGPVALAIAVFCYLLRQPLMNMAGPMTSELVMNYVGKRNQEMMSALTSAIWSGSWFISSIIFKVLRESGLAYVWIFYITAVLYALGVLWYHFLIKDYYRKETMLMPVVDGN